MPVVPCFLPFCRSFRAASRCVHCPAWASCSTASHLLHDTETLSLPRGDLAVSPLPRAPFSFEPYSPVAYPTSSLSLLLIVPPLCPARAPCFCDVVHLIQPAREANVFCRRSSSPPSAREIAGARDDGSAVRPFFSFASDHHHLDFILV